MHLHIVLPTSCMYKGPRILVSPHALKKLRADPDSMLHLYYRWTNLFKLKVAYGIPATR